MHHQLLLTLTVCLCVYCTSYKSFASFASKNSVRVQRIQLQAFADEKEALELLERASTVFGQNKYAIQGDDIYNAIKYLEKLTPEKRKKIGNAERLFSNLSPYQWQLILTTGDLDTQKTLGPQIK